MFGPVMPFATVVRPIRPGEVPIRRRLPSFLRLWRTPPGLPSVLCLLVLAACDDSFTPLAPGGTDFAVHGFLDASADTQWIRVTPVRGAVWTNPDPIGVTVRLRKVGEDREVELQDSVFWFPAGDSTIGSAGMYVHNFWTTETIEPGADYRLLVQFAGHTPGEIPVSVPVEYGAEVWRGSSRVPPLTSYLELLGVKHVPFVTLTASCGGEAAPYYLTPNRIGSDVHRVWLAPYFENCRGQFTVVGSEQEWPAGQGYSLSRMTEGAGNYSNALGFVGGVMIKLIPYENNCEFVGGGASQPAYCVLRYNAASASISGTVTEVRCGDGPIGVADVELRELDAVPPASAQKRSTKIGRDAGYSIGALVPGVRYAMRVWVDVEPWIAVYSVHTDTLMFEPGERLTHDVALELLSGCQNQPGEQAGGRP